MSRPSLYEFLAVLAFVSSLYVQLGASLQCYTCNQRVQDATTCLTAVMEDCSIVYPQKTSICVRSVQRSFDGNPPWVIAQCYALGMPTDPLLNQCESKEVRGRNSVLYTLEICTCTQDLCNRGPSVLPQTQPILPLPPLFPQQPVPSPALAVTSSLQCYKCNQRFQNAFTCRNPVVENCDQVLPGRAAVCGRRVQTFANGEPPWVLAQCEPQMGMAEIAASSNGVPSCHTENGRYENGRFDSVETCVCSTSLCNNLAGQAATLQPTAQLISPPIPGGFNQLRCYKCNERLVNRTTCANRSVEDCAVQYPNQPVACVRSVQTFSDGQAPWVVERCQIRALFPEARPNDCWSQPLTGSSGANGTDYLEFCTCISDLCNTESIMSTRLTQAVNAATSGGSG